ncbi:MAG: hypothetical protein ACLP5V_00525 [Candidatus Bathyarchaeia archaeon]
MRFSRKTSVLLALFVALVIVKVFLAMATPPSMPVVYYLEVQSYTRSPDSSNPWGRFNNATLSVWYSLPIDHPSLETFLTNKSIFLPFSLQLLLLLVKLPLIAADILIAFILFKLGKLLWPMTNRPYIAALSWFANPYAIFVTEMMGAVDVLPVATIMLGLLLVIKRKNVLGAASVAAGIALKLFPLVTIPAVLYSSRIAGSRLAKILFSALLVVLGLVAYVSWSQFPFSEAYYTQATTEFILGTESLYGIAVTPDFIGLATFAVIISYLLAYEFRPELFQRPLMVALFVLLAYVAFLDFQVEYILWVIPLFVIANIDLKRTIPLFVLILVTSFSLGFFTADGFTTSSGWTLLFFDRSSDWANLLLSSQFIDLVLRPTLRTLLTAFMLISMMLLWYSRIEPTRRDPLAEPLGVP